MYHCPQDAPEEMEESYFFPHLFIRHSISTLNSIVIPVDGVHESWNPQKSIRNYPRAEAPYPQIKNVLVAVIAQQLLFL